jgi:hypothetical protein
MTDMLLLRVADMDAEGIHVMASKTANSTKVKQTFTWLDEEGDDTGLRAAVDEALAARPLDTCPWLFCTEEGECYFDAETGRAGSFESVGQRFMDRALKETKVTERSRSATSARRSVQTWRRSRTHSRCWAMRIPGPPARTLGGGRKSFRPAKSRV